MEALTIHALVTEWNTRLLSSRIEKIHQPNDYEMVFTLRHRMGTDRLLLSAHKQYARAHLLTLSRPENPEKPPLFCTLMRKRIEGGKVIGIRQQGLDRVLELVVESLNELGDRETYVVICEMMGKHSNLILCTANEDNSTGNIVGAIVHVSADMSRYRRVLPGLPYVTPPQQDKLAYDAITSEAVADIDALAWASKSSAVALMRRIAGLGPLSAREILYRTANQMDNQSGAEILVVELKELFHEMLTGKACPSLGLDGLGRPIECAPFALTSAFNQRQMPTMSEAIETMYHDVAVSVHQTKLATELGQVVKQHLDWLRGKLSKIAELEADSLAHEELRIYGELLTAYAYQVAKGTTEVELPNFYNDENLVRIALDPALSPIENAQKYYKQSSKRKRSIAILASERQQTEGDLIYLDTIQVQLEGASVDNLEHIRTELVSEGFLKEKFSKPKQRQAKQRKTVSQKSKKTAQKPEIYHSTDGFVIRVGRNNEQNDRLTLKSSQPSDIWFHVKGQPGSHVVIQSESRTVPNSTLEQAALLATYFSKGRNSANVAVDYTEIKHVWKPNGARPGHVLYEHQKTVFVNPDRSLIDPLLQSATTLQD